MRGPILGLTLLGLSLLIAAPALAQSDNKDPDVTGGASINPDKNGTTGEAEKPPRGTAERSDCGLSPQEELLVGELRARLRKLADRELRLAAREAAMAQLVLQIRAEIARLEQLQTQVGAKLAVREDKLATDRGKRIAQVARILKKMKPDAAAPIIEKQSDEDAVATLEALGERSAAKILAAMPKTRAVVLARTLMSLPIMEVN